MYIKNILVIFIFVTMAITNIATAHDKDNVIDKELSMQKTYVLSYNQLIKNDMTPLLDYFQSKQISPEQIMEISSQEGGDGIDINEDQKGAIYKYKIGEIDTDTFTKKMIDIIHAKSEHLLTTEEFQEGWNKMCDISEETYADLSKLFYLQKIKKFNILIIARTNELQDTHIRKQLSKRSIDIDHQVNYVYSFKEHSLDGSILYNLVKNHYFTSKMFDFRNAENALQKIIETEKIKTEAI